MRLAILSDIHGNLVALEAVLEDIQTHAPFDHIIVAGDLAWGEPRPREVIDRLMESGALGVMGNTDAYMLGERSPVPTRELEIFPDDHPINVWTRDQLREPQWNYMLGLPFSRRYEPDPRGRLLVVHANPKNVDDLMLPDTTADELGPLLQNADADVIAHGHIHINSLRTINHLLLVNVASAGMPTDGDTRAAWDEFEWDAAAGKWNVTVHRVAYDVEATIRQLNELGRPESEKWANSLRTATYSRVQR